MILIHKITLFPLINTLSLYLILNIFFFEVLIRGQQLKEGGAYFNVTEANQISKLCFCPFQQWKWNAKPQNQKEKQIKNENAKISTIVSLFECL